jgi:transglutaminase-like putative cysteine protease
MSLEFLLAGLPEEIKKAEITSNINLARKLIAYWLSKDIPEIHRKRLEFEDIRLQRLHLYYPFTYNEALEEAKKLIDNFTEEEFKNYIEEGAIDFIELDGVRYFESRFAYNLGFRFPDIKRRTKEEEGQKKKREILEGRLKALIQGDTPKNYKVKARITFRVREPKGKRVKVWLPIPKESYYQEKVKVLNFSHPSPYIAPEKVGQRTIYMEGKDTEEFSVSFEYVIKEVWNRKLFEGTLNAFKGLKTNCGIQNLTDFLKEKPPHITFTPLLRCLLGEIIQGKDSIFEKAFTIYDFVTSRVWYSYVKPYIYYDHIPHFVVENLRGDCGFQALLFITLCRMAGIPAHWQSGWYITPYEASPHDWAIIYLPEFGFVPVDLSFGGKDKTDINRKAFYFGNLDGFRMIANDEFQEDFDPPTKFIREDPYDNQVGEAEYEDEKVFGEHRIEVLSFEEV